MSAHDPERPLNGERQPKHFMSEFEGKNRNYIVHLSLSCSGPDKATTRTGPTGVIQRRDSADLKFTTGDVDWLHSHFREPRPDSATIEKHFRCVNPQKADFLRTIDEAIAHLAQYRSNLDWDGGGLVLVYAGHGTEHTGAIVFPNEILEPEELARYLARRMPKSHRRLRVDLFFDSCFASVFVAHFLAYAWSELEDFLFPCTFFAAALPDEYAWEMPKLGHGVFTHAYKTESEYPSLAQPRLLLIVKMLWNRWRKKEPQRLSMGGVSYITNGAQHSLEYENGHFQLHGAGGFDILDLKSVSVANIISGIKREQIDLLYQS